MKIKIDNLDFNNKDYKKGILKKLNKYLDKNENRLDEQLTNFSEEENSLKVVPISYKLVNIPLSELNIEDIEGLKNGKLTISFRYFWDTLGDDSHNKTIVLDDINLKLNESSFDENNKKKLEKLIEDEVDYEYNKKEEDPEEEISEDLVEFEDLYNRKDELDENETEILNEIVLDKSEDILDDLIRNKLRKSEVFEEIINNLPTIKKDVKILNKTKQELEKRLLEKEIEEDNKLKNEIKSKLGKYGEKINNIYVLNKDILLITEGELDNEKLKKLKDTVKYFDVWVDRIDSNRQMYEQKERNKEILQELEKEGKIVRKIGIDYKNMYTYKSKNGDINIEIDNINNQQKEEYNNSNNLSL